MGTLQDVWGQTTTSDHLIGVIDLRLGHAVHAVAGDRARYAPLAPFEGSAMRLCEAYLGLGLRQFYIADLDAIEDGRPQLEQLRQIAGCWPEGASGLVDIGWRGSETGSQCSAIAAVAEQHPWLGWIAGSESAIAADAAAMLADLVGPQRCWIGLDYRHRQWISTRFSEAAWLESASPIPLAGAVVLDLHAVGRQSGPVTEAKCRALSDRFIHWQIVSGGGVRGPADARMLIDAGCSGVLVATAIQRAAGKAF